MKYYILAGEPSGELYGAQLMTALLKKDEDAQFRYWGGEKMKSVSSGLDVHIKDSSFMGFVEVVKNLPAIIKLFRITKESILEFTPDVIVLIDYPGFNLKLAKWAKLKGFKIVYYISPQVWAWKKGRVETIRKYVDELIVILPFEKEWFSQYNIDAKYVGHPLVPHITKFQDENRKGSTLDQEILALLPGSRLQEIKTLLPIMLNAVSSMNHKFEVVLAASPNVDYKVFQDLVKNYNFPIHIKVNEVYDVLNNATLALVASGTATLETALFNVPQVVVYKTSSINYFIGKRLVNLPFFSLVNLIAGKEIVPELLQADASTKNIVSSLEKVMQSNSLKEDYNELAQKLESKPGENPADLCAEYVINVASN